MGVFILLEFLCYSKHYSAFHSLLEELAALLVDALYRAGCVVCVCGASTGAIELCPAVATLFLGVYVTGSKLCLLLLIGYTYVDVTESVALITYELVAGIEITPGGNCHIFGSRATAGNSLVNTRTALEIDHIVIEGEGASLLMSFEHKLSELFVLLANDLDILVGKLCRTV